MRKASRKAQFTPGLQEVAQLGGLRDQACTEGLPAWLRKVSCLAITEFTRLLTPSHFSFGPYPNIEQAMCRCMAWLPLL